MFRSCLVFSLLHLTAFDLLSATTGSQDAERARKTESTQSVSRNANRLTPSLRSFQQLLDIENAAYRRANFFIWTFLIMMSVQFGGLARLTWWEYSWDIMEPVTYFVTYGTTMTWFIYYLVTKQVGHTMNICVIFFFFIERD